MKGEWIRNKYPHLSENTHLLSGLAVLFTLLFFSFELWKGREDSITLKQSHTLNYLTSIEGQHVFQANEASKEMMVATEYFREDPLTTLDNPTTKIIGDFHLHYANYINDNAALLKQYRKRVMKCLQLGLCDKDITKSYVCGNVRAYLYPVITQRQIYYQKCLQPSYPNHQAVSIDQTYHYFIDFCEVDYEKLTKFDSSFISKIEKSVCEMY